MPDGEAPTDLERLFAEAEQQTAVPLKDIAHFCKHGANANINALQPCPTCGWPFCPECASILDPTYCKGCLSEADAELKELPLKDEDGVTHEGRVLQPSGPRFATLCKSISDMSDHELEAYIKQYQDLIHQAEKALDFRRVVLGAAQIEGAQRADAKRRALRADKTKYPVRTVTINKATGKPKAAPASMLKLMELLKAMEAVKKPPTNK